MVKRIWKYGTGEKIPEGAVYLCTKTETEEFIAGDIKSKRNKIVWHYFLIDDRLWELK